MGRDYGVFVIYTMKDNIFKNLIHIADDFEIVKRGSQLVKGYKPDIVLQKENEFIIMECDTGTSRKGYLGGMIKAAKFLTNEKSGILIFAIKEKDNTKVSQIYEHLKDYYDWIKNLTNLNAIYIIAIDKYCPSETPLKILGKEFISHAMKISKEL
jgi:hypothetical protein